MPGIRTLSDNEGFARLLDEFQITIGRGNPFAYMAALQKFFKPPTVREDSEILAENFERMAAYLRENVTEDGAEIDLDALLRNHDLDPTIRSTKSLANRFLKDAGLVRITKAQPAQMVRQLANGSGNGAGADD